MVAAKIKPVSSQRPCPVCAAHHKCSTTTDGLILCGRSTGEQPGFRDLGEAADPTWNLYREAEPPELRRALPPAVQYRRVATLYEKKAQNVLAFVQVAPS